MIVGRKVGDVVTGPERHVAFAVNSEGHNDAGLAGNIAYNYWPELASTGAIRMGEILSKDAGNKVFHALVVHHLLKVGKKRLVILKPALMNFKFLQTKKLQA